METNTGAEPSAEYCPLCGQSNLCDMAACGTGDGCWCKEERFSEGLMAKIPAEKRGQACICRACVRRYNTQFYEAK